MANNSTIVRLTGYDFSPYGILNGKFVPLHVNALSCIGFSLMCAIAVLVAQFRSRKAKFYKWSTGERFVVYQALCDGTMNIVHSLDHSHMLIVRGHVTPSYVCKIYGAVLGYASQAQMLMALLISCHSFLVIYYNIRVPFGTKDRYLLASVYGTPVVILAIGMGLDLYGPSGAFCFTDYTKPMAFLGLLVVPAATVCILTTVLYSLTWLQIIKKTHAMKNMTTSRESASTAAAKTMSLFVAAFLVQWHMAAVFGIWLFVSPPPTDIATFLMTSLVNLGGFFNLIVYVLIRKRRRANNEATSVNSKSTKISTVEREKSNVSSSSIKNNKLNKLPVSQH